MFRFFVYSPKARGKRHDPSPTQLKDEPKLPQTKTHTDERHWRTSAAYVVFTSILHYVVANSISKGHVISPNVCIIH